MRLNQLTKTLSHNPTISNPLLEALIMLELVSHKSRSKLLSDDLELSKDQSQQLDNMINQRTKLPLAYITKTKQFYNLDFHINPNVLIPRAESEDIINLALELKPKFQQIYDVGCGSGCLAISYLKNISYQPATTLLDISQTALTVAQYNCFKHQLTKIKFDQLDLSNLATNYFKDNSLILANLPYLSKANQTDYEANCPTLKAEPVEALYATEKGLKLYKDLFRQCQPASRLHLICETLPNQQAELKVIAKTYGFKTLNNLNLATSFLKN